MGEYTINCVIKLTVTQDFQSFVGSIKLIHKNNKKWQQLMVKYTD